MDLVVFDRPLDRRRAVLLDVAAVGVLHALHFVDRFLRPIRAAEVTQVHLAMRV